MSSIAFPSRWKSAMAAFASLVALSAALAYVASPTQAQPSIGVAYSASAINDVHGVVKGPTGAPLAKAVVRVVFRDAAGRFVGASWVKVDASGHYATPIPANAKFVRVNVRESDRQGARGVAKVITVVPGQSVSLTAVFPARRGGLIPGLFTY